MALTFFSSRYLYKGGLNVLDLLGSEIEQVPTAFIPARINILPEQDLLVLTDDVTPALIYLATIPIEI